MKLRIALFAACVAGPTVLQSTLGQEPTAAVQPVRDEAINYDTPIGVLLAAMVTALSSTDPTATREFVQRYDPQASASQRADWVTQLDSIKKITNGDVHAYDALWANDYDMCVRITDSKRSVWHKLILEISKNKPHTILRVGLRRGNRPDNVEAEQLTQQMKEEVIAALAKELARGYIVEGVGTKTASLIKQRFRAGEYNNNNSVLAFAAKLTSDLRRATTDKHLSVLDPAALRRREIRYGASEDDDAQRSAHATSHKAVATHHAIRKEPGARVLQNVRTLGNDGRVGYIEIETSIDSQQMFERLAEIMQSFSVAPIDALILDVRLGGGGDGGWNQELLSYFYENRVHTMSNERLDRISGKRTVTETWVKPRRGGPTFPTIPIFLLTSSETISAGEALAFTLKRTHRATLVGEVTAGGGHAAVTVRLPHGLALVLPVARAFDPITKKGWEGVGIEPNIDCHADVALDVALEQITASSTRTSTRP